MLGVSDKAVSRWENGSSQPRATLLPKLADALGVSLDKLLSGREKASAVAANPASGDFSAQQLTDKSASDFIKVNFIPEKATENGNYLCTWALQQVAAVQLNIPGNNVPERQRNALSGQTVFREDIYHPFSAEYRSGLIFLLDDGWDVPMGTDASASRVLFVLCERDAEKFA